MKLWSVTKAPEFDSHKIHLFLQLLSHPHMEYLHKNSLRWL